MNTNKLVWKIASVVLALAMVVTLLPSGSSNVSAVNDEGRYVYNEFSVEGWTRAETQYTSFGDDATVNEDTAKCAWPSASVSIAESDEAWGTEDGFTGSIWDTWCYNTSYLATGAKSTAWSSDGDGTSYMVYNTTGTTKNNFAVATSMPASTRSNQMITSVTGLTVGAEYTVTFDYKVYSNYTDESLGAVAIIPIATSSTSGTAATAFTSASYSAMNTTTYGSVTVTDDVAGVTYESSTYYTANPAQVANTSSTGAEIMLVDNTGLYVTDDDGGLTLATTEDNDYTRTGTVTYTFTANAATMTIGVRPLGLASMSGYDPVEFYMDNVTISATLPDEYETIIEDDDTATTVPYVLPYEWDDDTFTSSSSTYHADTSSTTTAGRDELVTQVKSYITANADATNESNSIDYSTGSFSDASEWSITGGTLGTNDYYTNNSGDYLWNAWGSGWYYCTTTVKALAKGIYSAGVYTANSSSTAVKLYVVAKIDEEQLSESDAEKYEMDDNGYLILAELDSAGASQEMTECNIDQVFDFTEDYTYADIGIAYYGKSSSAWTNVGSFWLVGYDPSDVEVSDVQTFKNQISNGSFASGTINWTYKNDGTYWEDGGADYGASTGNSLTDDNGDAITYWNAWNNQTDTAWNASFTQYVEFDEDYLYDGYYKLKIDTAGIWNDGTVQATITNYTTGETFVDTYNIEDNGGYWSGSALNENLSEAFQASVGDIITVTITVSGTAVSDSTQMNVLLTNICLVDGNYEGQDYHGTDQFSSSNFNGGALGNYWSTDSETDADYTYGYSNGTFAKMLIDNETYGLSAGTIIYPEYEDSTVTGYYYDGGGDTYISADALTEGTDWDWTDDGYISIYNNSDTDSYEFVITQTIDFTYDATYSVSALMNGWLGTESSGATGDGSIVVTATDENGDVVYTSNLAPATADCYSTVLTDDTFTISGASEDDMVTYTFTFTVTLPGYEYGISVNMTDILLVEYNSSAVETPDITYSGVTNADGELVNGGSLITGVDLSSVIALEASGVIYTNANGEEQDVFEVLAESGVNYVRVRVWNNPYDSTTGSTYGGGSNDAATAVAIAKRAARAGLKLYVDFHYSDFWADPSHQIAPKDWDGLDADEIADKLYTFTYEVLTEIAETGVDIGIVSIGNESNKGIAGVDMWDGDVVNQDVITLYNAGLQAVDDFSTDATLFNDSVNYAENHSSILTAIHYAPAGDYDVTYSGYWSPYPGSSWWFANELDANGIADYDIFALSYYPTETSHTLNGTPYYQIAQLSSIAEDFGKLTMIAEYDWPFTYTDTDGYSAGQSSSSTTYSTLNTDYNINYTTTYTIDDTTYELNPAIINGEADDDGHDLYGYGVDYFTQKGYATYDETTGTYTINKSGQYNMIVDIISITANEITNCIGSFYWEPAWVAVGTNEVDGVTSKVTKWATYGAGLCTSYGGEYLGWSEDSSYGGITQDINALFKTDSSTGVASPLSFTSVSEDEDGNTTVEEITTIDAFNITDTTYPITTTRAQTSTVSDGYYSFRIVGAVSSTDLAHAGYRIFIYDADGESCTTLDADSIYDGDGVDESRTVNVFSDKDIDKVYSSIKANTVSYTPSEVFTDENADYFYVFTYTKINAENIYYIEVMPYAEGEAETESGESGGYYQRASRIYAIYNGTAKVVSADEIGTLTASDFE